ncbi:MAG: carboxypeptidase regulatory-like domain-containing protein [Pyrinomonadaceae bacterium]
MLKKSIWFGIAIFTVCLTFSVVTIAQEVTGDIVGTVRDTNGAGVPNASVTITDSAKNIVVRVVQTNADGEFSAPNLSTSTFSVTIEAPNFKKSVRTGVKVDLGQRRNVDVTLEAGNISETVTVTADAVGVELSTPTAGTTINGDQVREISINNRNWVQLVALAPGVSNDLSDQVYVGTTNPEGQANTINISVNGGRSSQNTFTVDGADVTDRGSNITIQAYPSVDSIGEFRVLRSLYPAESGRSGGGQINVVTRSGTSDFHGSVFEFYRGRVLNANNFLLNGLSTPLFGREANGKARRASFNYDNYGGTIGGPIYFLNFGEKAPGEPYFKRYERTFFFFSYERREDSRFGSASTISVPDANLRNGIFPVDVCINRNNVVTETCAVGNPGRLTAGNALPASMYSPAARAYLTQVYSKFPLPNNPIGGPYSLTTAVQNISDFKQAIIKIDHSFSDALSGYYRYQRDQIPTEDGNALFSSGSSIPGVSTTSTNSPGRTHTAQMTWAAKSNLIVEGRFTYGYGAILSQNIGALALTQSQIPVTLPFANQRDRIPTVTGNGFQGLTSFGPYDNFSYKRNWSGGVTWISGSHTMKYGIVFSQYRKNENALAGNNEGIFNSFTSTVASGVTNNTTNQNIARWANFLVGNVAANGFSQASFDYTADLRQKAIEAYAQDEWRFRSNITLYYGVRYSYFGSPYDKNGRLTNFEPSLWTSSQAPQVTGAGVRILNVAGVPNGNWCNGIIVNSQNFTTGPSLLNCNPTVSPYGKYVVDVNKTDFAPRVGIAWDPFEKGMTSIRAGYGMYHEQVLNGTALQNIGLNPPFQVTATSPAATRLDAPVAAATQSATVQSLRALQTNWNTPYMQHWSLDFQQQIGKKTVFTVGYFGSRGVHLIGVTELNSLAPGVALRSMCAPGTTYYAQTPAPTLVACQPPGYVFRNAGSATTVVPENPNVQPGTGIQTTDILILDQLRPYKGFRGISIIQPRYNSNYHSMQVSGVHRFSSSSQVNLAYTWSKNLTDNQTDRSTAPVDGYNSKAEFARATLDRRHVFNVNYIYALPFFVNRRDLAGQVLGGWQVSGIFTYNTGLGFTPITSSFDPAGLGIINTNPTARPILLCDPNVNAPRTQQQYFNTSCFQPNPSNTANTRLLGFQNVIGNAGRGIIEGPPTFRIDFTLAKSFKFNESMSLQLRAEAFNILNHTNLRGFSSLNNTSTLFGVVGTVRDPRTMALGAKFYF